MGFMPPTMRNHNTTFDPSYACNISLRVSEWYALPRLLKKDEEDPAEQISTIWRLLDNDIGWYKIARVVCI